MNALQVQCANTVLRSQTAGQLLIVPLAFSAIRTIVPARQSTTTQTRQLHARGPPIQPSRRMIRRPTSCRCSTMNPFFTQSTARQYTSPVTIQTQKQPTIHPLFEPRTGTFQYLVADPATNQAVIIDPVLDYDKCTHTITTATADALLSLAREKGYTVTRILETHAHADHLTASFYLQRKLAAQQQQEPKPDVCIGARIGKVQSLFGERYGIAADEYEGVFDKLLGDDEEFMIGTLKARAMHLPGHTPDHMGYMIGDNVFVGDSLFHVDIGTARCDFPGGSAHDLYQSAKKLLSLPGHVQIWTGHDYPPEGEREPVPGVSVAEHRERNKHLRDGVTEKQFVAMRRERDAHLAAPRLLHESLQVNVRAGRLPKENEAGMRLLKVPLKTKGTSW
ncbi:putative beta-lactamase hydrolase-like protein [Echria macrotheca]|uniref:Beta-lactamase hydrolase-like protein n=1 Tax=Echria macrotheca TaxID=438768 RepID=A0AAJ0B2H4_9PEZI|nr:putative beta-lactamase hydrolase-like protein [Echria macrotheca]